MNLSVTLIPHIHLIIFNYFNMEERLPDDMLLVSKNRRKQAAVTMHCGQLTSKQKCFQ